MYKPAEERLREKIREMLRDVGAQIGMARTEQEQRNARRLYKQLKDIEGEVDLMKEDLIEMYLRNSAYPGDMVGWLDDDFDDDDDEDESDDNTDKTDAEQ